MLTRRTPRRRMVTRTARRRRTPAMGVTMRPRVQHPRRMHTAAGLRIMRMLTRRTARRMITKTTRRAIPATMGITMRLGVLHPRRMNTRPKPRIMSMLTHRAARRGMIARAARGRVAAAVGITMRPRGQHPRRMNAAAGLRIVRMLTRRAPRRMITKTTRRTVPATMGVTMRLGVLHPRRMNTRPEPRIMGMLTRRTARRRRRSGRLRRQVRLAGAMAPIAIVFVVARRAPVRNNTASAGDPHLPDRTSPTTAVAPSPMRAHRRRRSGRSSGRSGGSGGRSGRSGRRGVGVLHRRGGLILVTGDDPAVARAGVAAGAAHRRARPPRVDGAVAAGAYPAILRRAHIAGLSHRAGAARHPTPRPRRSRRAAIAPARETAPIALPHTPRPSRQIHTHPLGRGDLGRVHPHAAGALRARPDTVTDPRRLSDDPAIHLLAATRTAHRVTRRAAHIGRRGLNTGHQTLKRPLRRREPRQTIDHHRHRQHPQQHPTPPSPPQPRHNSPTDATRGPNQAAAPPPGAGTEPETGEHQHGLTYAADTPTVAHNPAAVNTPLQPHLARPSRTRRSPARAAAGAVAKPRADARPAPRQEDATSPRCRIELHRLGPQEGTGTLRPAGCGNSRRFRNAPRDRSSRYHDLDRGTGCDGERRARRSPAGRTGARR